MIYRIRKGDKIKVEFDSPGAQATLETLGGSISTAVHSSAATFPFSALEGYTIARVISGGEEHEVHLIEQQDWRADRKPSDD